jgi:hypothetical protein
MREVSSTLTEGSIISFPTSFLGPRLAYSHQLPSRFSHQRSLQLSLGFSESFCAVKIGKSSKTLIATLIATPRFSRRLRTFLATSLT